MAVYNCSTSNQKYQVYGWDVIKAGLATVSLMWAAHFILKKAQPYVKTWSIVPSKGNRGANTGYGAASLGFAVLSTYAFKPVINKQKLSESLVLQSIAHANQMEDEKDKNHMIETAFQFLERYAPDQIQRHILHVTEPALRVKIILKTVGKLMGSEVVSKEHFEIAIALVELVPDGEEKWKKLQSIVERQLETDIPGAELTKNRIIGEDFKLVVESIIRENNERVEQAWKNIEKAQTEPPSEKSTLEGDEKTLKERAKRVLKGHKRRPVAQDEKSIAEDLAKVIPVDFERALRLIDGLQDGKDAILVSLFKNHFPADAEEAERIIEKIGNSEEQKDARRYHILAKVKNYVVGIKALWSEIQGLSDQDKDGICFEFAKQEKSNHYFEAAKEAANAISDSDLRKNAFIDIINEELKLGHTAALATATEAFAGRLSQQVKDGSNDAQQGESVLAKKVQLINNPDAEDRDRNLALICKIESRTNLKKGLATAAHIIDSQERLEAILEVARIAIAA